MLKTKIPALVLFLFVISFASAENRAARLESRRWTAAAFVHCRSASPELEAGLSALLADHIQAVANLDLVEGNDLQLASRSVGDTSEPDVETAKKAGIDASIDVSCRLADGKIEWEGSLVTAGDTVRVNPAQLPLRQAGQVPYQVIRSLLSRARDGKMLPPSIFTAEDESLLAHLVRPQYETLLAYGRARINEKSNSYVATQHLRQALVIDPDFYPAYARLFYTYYIPQPNAYFAEVDIVSQSRVRLNSVEAIWIARAFYDLALSARSRGWWPASETYHRRSLALLQSGGREKSLLSSFNLSRIGEAYIPTQNRMPALYNIQTAREMMESQGLDQNIFYAINLIHLGTLYSLDGKTDVAVWLMDRARKFDGSDSLFSAFIYANSGAILLKQGSGDAALDAFRRARTILRDKEYSHSLMYMTLLVAEANALRTIGDTRAAEVLYNSVVSMARILGLDGSQPHVDALNGLGMTGLARGDSAGGQSYLRLAYFLQMRIGARPAGDFFTVSQLPIRSPLGLVEEESTRIASYTGAFSYYAHSRNVQARTYAGRLDDTNVLIKDLLDPSRTANPALNALRKTLLGSSPRPGGEGVHFVDIGPAIANRVSPGVTAVSIARDFPYMTVIALDLPEQVEIFRHQVHPALRSRVLDFPNFHIIAGNGVSSLKDQFAENGRWFEPKKKRPTIRNGDPVILRAANSIDIYERWQTNQDAMMRIGQDYLENPVLYFFNRSLLFKPAHSSHFSIIGMISKAGFDHMYETFDRGGDSAYTLIDP